MSRKILNKPSKNSGKYTRRSSSGTASRAESFKKQTIFGNGNQKNKSKENNNNNKKFKKLKVNLKISTKSFVEPKIGQKTESVFMMYIPRRQ